MEASASEQQQQQRYAELFCLCGGGGGNAAGSEAGASGSKVAELFRASQLPPEALLQITELCGAKRVGYFGRTQFYVALKLIAAAQSGLPIRIESIQNELPLPRFMALKTDSETRYSHQTEAPGTKFQIPHATLEKNCFRRLDEGEKQQETQSPPMSPIGSPPASPSSYQRMPLSYGYGILRSGVEQQQGGSYEARILTQQQDGPTSGNYGSKSLPAHSSLVRSLSVEREPQDSSSNYPDDPWRITEEQREYYINQFKSLQPDLNSFISGSVAKNFFTKSKLPIPELSHIWELSDVDRDGALTLAEFCAAFHLVVARKNGYLLPDTLPETLLPDYLQAGSFKSKSDRVVTSYSESLSISQQTRDFGRTEETPLEEVSDKVPLTQDTIKDDKQGVKISTSAQAVPKEFKVSQHVAIKTVAQESNTMKARPRSRSYSSTSIEDAVKKGGEPPTPPPRPQKSHSRASSLDLNKIFQQNTQALRAGWVPPPPPPALPPRPFASQVCHPNTNAESNSQPKSSYGDFRLQEQMEQESEAEVHLPLSRASSQAEENSPIKKEVLLTQPPSKPIRRKFHPESQMLENQEVSPTKSVASSLPAIKSHHSIPKQSSKQKKAIQTAIRKNKEANAVLARLNSELQQQLKEVHRERTALESQLEQLRPVTVL
ncbi:ralBP1-associated Eps domain-containing protein 2 isoform X1 [Anolis carolinensis]|uniref:ralBP1-associated Eps domain-containing protein 2 isoform X1 n=1 Tax=Anolis carolinensis TaxID=28377 RepID=UPI000462B732|nr:PREDICTED: ralBP1-associated Eps domain-containing protein 2 isoform X1 [Anolis carolinensis]|eukprot:XP_003218914.2 PREDICTED: ralBP1-associated Eps domain-containing protein 2 isoform X1 [Anolis carolinensis]